MNRGAHGDSSLMLSTLVLSNENRQLAGRREEAPTSSGGGGCHDHVSKMEKKVHRTRRNWKKEGDELVEYTKGVIKVLTQKYEELSG